MNTPTPQVWPSLHAHDARALISFLVDVVGFEQVVAYEDGDRVAHAELAWPEGGGVMLGSTRPDGDSATRAGAFGAYVVTADPDALHDRVRAAGAAVVTAPFDTDYGSRDFAIEDPEGNRWNFGTYPGHPRA